MFLGVLSALALGVGIMTTANDLVQQDTDVEKPVVQVEQIQHDAASTDVELDR